MEKKKLKFMKKVDAIYKLPILAEREGEPDERMMDRVRNRKPEAAHEIKKEVRELSKLVDIRKEMKELQEQLARLIAELGEKEAEM